MASGFNPWRCLVAFLVFGIGSLSHQAIADEPDDASELRNCDLFRGSWVRDDSYPIYEASSCPFIDQGFDCLKNGRTDKDYLKYRWKPSDCDLPRFDGRSFLERERGKKILFVGDSLSNNMWQSLTCMLHSAVPGSQYSLTQEEKLSKFSIPDYGVSVMWLKNGFLVDLVPEKMGKVLKLDSITSGDEWKGYDMLIFNTYHRWLHQGQSQTWDYFQVGNTIVKEMDRMKAFGIALSTWSKWIDGNIDPRKTQVFFQGVSATHSDGKDWNETSAQTCQGQTEPVMGSVYPGPSIPGEDIVKNVLSMMVNPPKLLDFTLLTQLRKDGHPSIFTGQGKSTDDCSHWCLAGVPDSWNVLLNTILLLINPNGTSGSGMAPSPEQRAPLAPSPQPDAPPASSPPPVGAPSSGSSPQPAPPALSPQPMPWTPPNAPPASSPPPVGAPSSGLSPQPAPPALSPQPMPWTPPDAPPASSPPPVGGAPSSGSSPQPEAPPALSPQPMPWTPPEAPPALSPQPMPWTPPSISSPPPPVAPASTPQPEASPPSPRQNKSAGHAVLPAYVGHILVQLAPVLFLILLI